MRGRRWIGRGCAGLLAACGLLIGVAKLVPPPWWRVEAGPPASTFSHVHSIGTGAFVTRSGWLLTAAHAVAGCRRLTVGNAVFSGLVVDRVVLPAERALDLALVHVTARPRMALPLDVVPWPIPAGAAPLDRSVIVPDLKAMRAAGGTGFSVLGFPGTDHAAAPVTMPAALLGAESSDGRHWLLRLSAPVRPGSSGSVVLDARGGIAGIVVSGAIHLPVIASDAERRRALRRLSGTATQALAVPAAFAAGLLEAEGPDVSVQPSPAPDAAAAMVRVFCWS